MFSLPLQSYLLPSRSKGDHDKSRKRKRKGSYVTEQQKSEDGQATNDLVAFFQSRPSSQQSGLSAVLTPDEIYQYAVAGQPVEDELPSFPFPHTDSDIQDGPSRFEYELRQQLKPAHVSFPGRNGVSTGRSLHQQHLAVMTTILHRSFQEEDFVRAGRALGMILRDETGGKPIDIRAQGRWGIGAEILMRQDAQKQYQSQKRLDVSINEQDQRAEKPRAWLTRKGFEDAKKYYERLIVQYPFWKSSPGSVSALDFYPAMFGLWIYVVHREAKLKTAESMSSGNESDGNDEFRDEPASPLGWRSWRRQVTMEERSQARDIADRMDSIMSAPPYKENAELIDLRKMVELWIHDLEDVLAMLTEDSELRNEREDIPMEVLTSGVTNVSLQGQT